ncbi:MAG: DUF5696 domain-containing protein [Butyrivibrio sp.]|nr:DUF5696 domain-containing protein [Butyrivibrio sp.]
MCKKTKSYKLLFAAAVMLSVLIWGGSSRVRAEEDYILAAENGKFALYYQPDSLAVRVRDKTTGYVYDSRGPEAQEGDLNNTWTGMKKSGISIECRLTNGNVRTWTITGEGAEVKTEPLADGFQSHVDFSGEIGFDVRVTLSETGMEVYIPQDSITEGVQEGTLLQSIYVYPFFGSSYGYDNDGYLFVPDGCGALISTGSKTVAAENYEKQIYGSDIGMGGFKSEDTESMLKNAGDIYMPVFGSVEEEGVQGFAGIVKEGDAYCRILAYASGIRTPYNLIMPKFIVRETYQMRLSQSGSSLVKNQEERNPGDIRVGYVLLSGQEAGYVGMAHAYRQWLLESGVLTKEQDGAGEVPLKLEFVLSEQKDGLLFSKTVKMTTVEQVEEILQELLDAGISNMVSVLRGYSGKGASAAAPASFSFTGKVGSRSEWKKVVEKFSREGIDISLYADFSRGYEGVGGFGSSQKAQAVNRNMLETYDNGIFNWLAPSFAAEKLNSFAEKAAGMGMESLSVDAFGATLYSNWNKKNTTTRAEAMEIFKQADSAGLQLNLYTPHAYLWGNCGRIYDIPLDSSNYYIFTETVPFMQIVLKGCIPYYSEGWNFHANRRQDLLKCIEYGAFPSWYVTEEDSVELMNTASSWIYSSQYQVWKDSMIQEYAEIDQALGGVLGAGISSRVCLDRNVWRIDYDNGVSIYVNYGPTDWTGEGVTVGGENWLVYEGGAS